MLEEHEGLVKTLGEHDEVEGLLGLLDLLLHGLDLV